LIYDTLPGCGCRGGGEGEAELGFPGRDFFAAAFGRAAPSSPGTYIGEHEIMEMIFGQTIL